MVSSSVFRGVAKSAVGSSTTIKIPKGMGYGGRASTVDPKYLAPKNTPIEETLLETNNILVEIQKQLSLDFAYRIAKEKNDVNKIRAASDKEKRIKKEKNIESNKILKSIGGVTNKVLAPAKGIFSKILDFLAAIGTGFIVNKGLKWLSENPDLIDGVFTFVKDNWKWILGIIGGVLIGKVVYKIVKLYRALRGAARFLRTGRFNKPQTSGGDSGRRRGGIFRNAQGQRRGSLTIGREVQSRVVPGKFNVAGGAVRENVEVITRQKGVLNKALQGVEVSAKKFSRNIIKSLGMGPGSKTIQKTILKFARPILKRIPFVGAILDFALSVALGEDPGRAAFGAIGAGLLGAIGTFLGGPVGTFIGGFAGDWAGRRLYDLFFGNKGEDPNAKEAKGMNKGGTVIGKDIGDKDSVPTILTVGEKVVPREQSKPKKFGPFIDDIIRDKGSLYGGMVVALREQEENNNLFKKTNESFENTIKELSEKNKPKLRNIGSSPSISPPTQSNTSTASASNTIKPVGKDTTLSLKKKEEGGPETIMLPMQRSGSNRSLSEAAMSSGSGGSSIPIFGAEDPENTYIEFMKMQFGIYGV